MNEPTSTIDRRSVEAAILGAMTLLEDATEYAAAELQGDEFGFPDHRVIFTAVCRMREQGIPVDGVTLAEELIRAGDFEAAGGGPGIFRILESVPHAAHCRFYVEQLQAIHQRDCLKVLSDRLRLRAEDPTLSPSQSIDDTLQELETLRAGRAQATELTTAREALELFDQRSNDQSAIVKTGIHALDSRLGGGLRPGQLVVIGGRPGLGKSALMAQMILNAGQARKPGLIISLEMTAGEHAGRALTTIQRERFAELPVLFSEASNFGKLINLTRLAKRRHEIAVVAVDYLQLMEKSDSDDRYRERTIATMSRGLKRLAMELQIPVLLGSQLNRESEKRGRPSLADLRESGAIEQDADTVILIAGDAETDERELIIAKHRGGSPGMVKMRFEGAKFAFTSEPWTGNL